MPVHDWSKTYAGAFHHLHVTWLVEIARALNQGLLPAGYYALGEQVDLHPPGPFDPRGLHNLVWAELGQEAVKLPAGRPLQVVSYLSQRKVSRFIEPLRVGDRLPDAPLFLDDGRFVLVPLESTYMTSFEAMPEHLRKEFAGG